MSVKELPKVIDKSQADIDEAINAIHPTYLAPAHQRLRDFVYLASRIAPQSTTGTKDQAIQPAQADL